MVLIDTRDPAIYAEAHIQGAVDMREVLTYLATSTPQGMVAMRRPSVKRACSGRGAVAHALMLQCETAILFTAWE